MGWLGRIWGGADSDRQATLFLNKKFHRVLNQFMGVYQHSDVVFLPPLLNQNDAQLCKQEKIVQPWWLGSLERQFFYSVDHCVDWTNGGLNPAWDVYNS